MRSPHILLPLAHPAGTTEIVDSGSTGATFTVVNGGTDAWNEPGWFKGSLSHNYFYSDHANVLEVINIMPGGILFGAFHINNAALTESFLLFGSFDANEGGFWPHINTSGIRTYTVSGGVISPARLWTGNSVIPAGVSHVAFLIDTVNGELRFWVNGNKVSYNQAGRDGMIADLRAGAISPDVGLTVGTRVSNTAAGARTGLSTPMRSSMKNLFLAQLSGVENPWRYADRAARLLVPQSQLRAVPPAISEVW